VRDEQPVEGVSLSAEGFDAFAARVGARLQRGFVVCRGVDAAGDATAEALAYAWQHWSRVEQMDNPAGYLYRVGLSRTRRRRRPVSRLPEPLSFELPDVEPKLVPALRRLPESQRIAVWLVHGSRWSYSEVAVGLDVGVTTVGTHVSRALASLRVELGADEHVER
jgi:DNA-directed RNA polymerase specialized sigma24 family protein